MNAAVVVWLGFLAALGATSFALSRDKQRVPSTLELFLMLNLTVCSVLSGGVALLSLLRT